MIIVGPNAGQKTHLFNGPSSSSTSGMNLTFNDHAAEQMPITGPIVSGTYQPGQNRFPGTPLVFSAPAPAGPYSTTFGSTGTPVGNVPFIGATNPNGDYSLYVQDYVDGDGGSIASWSISITFEPVPEPTSILLGAARLRHGGSGNSPAVENETGLIEHSMIWKRPTGSGGSFLFL